MSLTLRIFLITSALLIAACAITYAAIAYLTPITYTSILADELREKSEALILSLSKGGPGDGETLLSNFSLETGADILVLDGEGHVLFGEMPAFEAVSFPSEAVYVAEMVEVVPTVAVNSYTVTDYAQSATTTTIESATEIDSSGAILSSIHSSTASDSAFTDGVYPFFYADGTFATAYIQGGTRAVNQAVDALGQVLPFLIGVVLLISMAGSFFYARFITRPIVSISRIARHMAAMDFGARWQKRRRDEIGDLGDSLNLLSDNLSNALHELEAANLALRQDIDRERELERQRMAFFSAASHELKTPITILKGQLSGMLAQVGVYQDREKYLARALEVTGRMEGLVKEILTINRIGSGGYALKVRAVDLSGLVLRQLELDQELIDQKSLALHTHITPDITVQGNEDLLAKVVDNALINAILYSPAGESIVIAVSEGSFSIENTGVSIPEEALGQLFTPFYRVEQSRNRKSGGSGLGLYLAKSILDLHGAACLMENTENGVKFSVFFAEAPLQLPA